MQSACSRPSASGRGHQVRGASSAASRGALRAGCAPFVGALARRERYSGSASSASPHSDRVRSSDVSPFHAISSSGVSACFRCSNISSSHRRPVSRWPYPRPSVVGSLLSRKAGGMPVEFSESKIDTSPEIAAPGSGRCAMNPEANNRRMDMEKGGGERCISCGSDIRAGCLPPRGYGAGWRARETATRGSHPPAYPSLARPRARSSPG
jgi:hypothetical protein